MKPLIVIAALALSACTSSIQTAPKPADDDGPSMQSERPKPRPTVERFTVGGNDMTYRTDGVTQSISFDKPLRAR